jgi:putative flavoprotein involved in K+ transport
VKPADWLEKFGSALARGEINAATEMFEPGGYWRDLVSFTWNIKTCEGRGEIKAMLAARLSDVKPSRWIVRGQPTIGKDVSEAWFTFETELGRGFGHLRLRGKHCWTLLTTLQELKGFEEKAGAQRESGIFKGTTWLENRRTEAEEIGIVRQPYVVIVGGGQGGIALAARLKRLRVPALVVEKNERAGDSWRKRYKTLCLHDPVWYDHMPYLPFPDHWPVFSPKDKIGDWLEMYARVMELDYWGSTKCMAARYLEDKGEWEVIVNRGGDPYTLRPKHLVLATGMSGFPNVPVIPGADSFAGRSVHSSQYAGGEDWSGKQGVVVGSGTSAHDICQDLVEQGAAGVAMVQRAPTIVARSQTLMDLAWGPLYSEQALARGITTEIADLTVASVPHRVLPELQKSLYKQMRQRDADLYVGLEMAGFQHYFGEDDSGIHALYLRRGAGYYIETGASQMIIDGKIKVKSGVKVERVAERGVHLSDGTELPADLIVYATGYGSMNQWARELISSVVADKVGKCWGLGSDTKDDPGPWVGELRNMWKPTQQPNLWFHGGNLMQSRHYSLYLALQLKARMENLPTPVYYLEPAHHLQ